MHIRALSLSIVAVVLVTGCASKGPSANPSFPISLDDARTTLLTIESNPKPLDRPLVILNGFLDPGIGGAMVSSIVRHHVSDTRIITVAYPLNFSFEECRKKVIEAVDRAYPSADATQTTQVDVIGLSMGGLLARYCAAPGADHKRLNVCRLFTVSAPHQGAVRAVALPPLLQMQLDMRPNSPFLHHLEQSEEEAHYEIIPYVRLEDDIIGPKYAAPKGSDPWWVPNQPLHHAHIGAATDPRIMADILRRLRDEKPLTKNPPAPLPA